MVSMQRVDPVRVAIMGVRQRSHSIHWATGMDGCRGLRGCIETTARKDNRKTETYMWDQDDTASDPSCRSTVLGFSVDIGFCAVGCASTDSFARRASVCSLSTSFKTPSFNPLPQHLHPLLRAGSDSKLNELSIKPMGSNNRALTERGEIEAK